MILNAHVLLHKAPIKDMLSTKQSNGDVSFGLSEAGYDIRIKQEILFSPREAGMHVHTGRFYTETFGGIARRIPVFAPGRFCLASAIEEFDMPDDLVGIVHDKSTWARRGLSVFNTVIEPGWKGFLTLELVYHGQEDLFIPAGSGIAQVVFHETAVRAAYKGKYQNQDNQPVAARSA